MLIEIEKSKKIITLKDRRAHLKLTIEQRRRELAEQADKLARYYETEKQSREQWQGGDIVEF
jgi:hypothetical protein